MARLYNNFEFVGALNFTNEPMKERKAPSGWVTSELKLIINESKTNGQFVKLEGGLNVDNGKPNVVYTMSKSVFGSESGSMQVPWDDRLIPQVVDNVADFRKVVIDLTEDKETLKEFYETKRKIYNLESKTEGVTDADKDSLQELYTKSRELAPDRHEFIHAVDAINFLVKGGNLEKYKGRKFRIKGDLEKSYYNEKFYTNYVIKSIELVDEETPSKLAAQLDLFFVKGCEDTSAFKNEKVLTYETYVLGRDNNAKKDVFFPHGTVLNASKLDLENEQHKGRLDFIRDIFAPSGKKVHHMVFETRVVRGAQKVEFTAKDLTPKQRKAVELGLAALESFAPKGGLNGENIEEVRLLKPLFQTFNKANDFADGVIETDFTEDDLVFTPVVYNKPAETVKEKIDEEVKQELEDDFNLDLGESVEQSIDDLLGL